MDEETIQTTILDKLFPPEIQISMSLWRVSNLTFSMGRGQLKKVLEVPLFIENITNQSRVILTPPENNYFKYIYIYILILINNIIIL